MNDFDIFKSGGAGTVQELKRDIHGLIAAKTNFHLGKKNKKNIV
jgi:hypothetical protein